MRFECSSCQTVYEGPDALIGPVPKTMRCARCAREWTVAAPGGTPIESVPEPVALAPVIIPPRAAVLAKPQSGLA